MGNAFGSICTVGDRVVAAPTGADQLLVYSTSTDEFKGFDIGQIAMGPNKYSNLVNVDGTIVAVPWNAKQILVCRLSDRLDKIIFLKSSIGGMQPVCCCTNLNGQQLGEFPLAISVHDLRQVLASTLEIKTDFLQLVLPTGICATEDNE